MNNTVKLQYITCCVHANGNDIIEMVDTSKEITFATFMKKVSLSYVSNLLGYRRGPLTLRNDYHVRYFKGKYRGRPCYFLIHSAIEYIFG